ncbi:hypothetical protein BCR34DRAFT_69501 [Clohesyomyces aquaticus]|uniref:RBR-type E3 ubiquitin transferase n=1 Tax=Clohesyomyces aquaticus TaxID=1231657 RepID=A0A1Y1YZV0_9PLEO|nr:hypothetical protein BCR34DRAFT_69501 [Clohesyomyces aquaticus]
MAVGWITSLIKALIGILHTSVRSGKIKRKTFLHCEYYDWLYHDTSSSILSTNRYHQVSSYRTALQRLKPRPRRQQMELATKLWSHCVKTGIMQGCIDAPNAGGISVWGRLDTPVGQNLDSNNCMFPIFPSLIKRTATSKECIVCAEDKFEVNYGTWEEWTRLHSEFPGPWMWEILEFPIGEHQRCSHSLDVCRECVATHIATCVNDANLTRIACPQCDRIFDYEEIEKLSRRELFERYDKLLLRNVLSKLPNFRWCLNPTCDSGQVYDNIDSTLACIQCRACNFRMCFRHEQPWHVGLNCTEFTSALAGDPKYLETQKIIKNSTKACPQCTVRIEKGSGCFHMTCSKCKHEFCWECLASWKDVRYDKAKHAEGCYFRTSTQSPTRISGTDLATALRRS